MTVSSFNQSRPAPHYITPDTLTQSAIDGLMTKDITQYLKITKFTLQKYLEACVHPQGQFRKFFDNFATFTQGFTINENLDGDPTKRHLQIASFFRSTREQPPHIFIQDGGYRYVPSSLGGFSAGFRTKNALGQHVIRVTDVIEVPIEFSLVATDEQVCEDLMALVTAAFSNSFQRFTCGNVLRPAQPQVVENASAYWEVRIPLDHQMGAKSHSSLHEDSNDQFWEATCSMTVDFENSTYMHYRADPQYIQTSGALKIQVPDKISIRRRHPIPLRDLTFPFRIYSDDRRIAIIEQTNSQFTIVPRRVGTFNIIIAKPGFNERKASIVGTKQVEIIAR